MRYTFLIILFLTGCAPNINYNYESSSPYYRSYDTIIIERTPLVYERRHHRHPHRYFFRDRH